MIEWLKTALEIGGLLLAVIAVWTFALTLLWAIFAVARDRRRKKSTVGVVVHGNMQTRPSQGGVPWGAREHKQR